ncbi:MAG: extracellular solute-binding protein [Eubacteriales bacterium]
MKKISVTRALCLVLALMLTALPSCSNNTGEAEDTSPAVKNEETLIETEEENLTPAQKRQQIPDNLPERNFDGRSYIIATEADKAYEICSEELLGEATNDSVFDRNLRIEKRFNVSIEALETTTPYDNVKTVVTSGTYAYDVVAFWNFKAYVPIMAQVLYNWNDIPVDLSQPWFNQLANDPADINGKLFVVNSDLSISTLQYTYGMFFNTNIWNNYGYSSQDFYDMVFEGTWTIDKMTSVTSGIWEDTNGDGKHDRDDIHGYSVFLGLNTTDVWLAALDLNSAVINDDGTYELTFFNEKTVSALEKALALSYNETGTYRSTSDWRDVPRAFAEGKIAMTQLYFGETTESLGDMEDTYGILPLPKFDESQSNYYTNAWDQFSVFAIPKTISEDDKEVTGIIFEALSAESYKTVFPAYYDQALKSRYSSDATTAQIIDLIMEGRKLDFMFQFGEYLASLPYMFRQKLASNSTDITSSYKTYEKVIGKSIQKVIDVYMDEG